MPFTTRKMSDAHEDHLVEVLGGRKTKGSGNQWRDPADGRHSVHEQEFAFGWDGKSTLAKSLSISLAMWEKIREQASPLRPMIPLRFYRTERLAVSLDLVVISLEDFTELLEAANGRAK